MEQGQIKFSNSDFFNLAKLIQKQIHLSSYDLTLANHHENKKNNHPNKFCRYGKKMFSQADEDGITLEIVKRLKIKKGNFIEFGVGDGLENNTIILLSLGWQGIWFGGENIVINTKKSNRLTFYQNFITLKNILDLTEYALTKINTIELISLDLDGNDYYFIEELLKNGIRPKVFIAEYNSKFIPPVEFVIEYNEDHKWKNNDYYGCSLASLDKMFKKYGYRLICCNAASGSNCFFVQDKYMNLFDDVPNNIDDIFAEPNYKPYQYYGHPTSRKTIETIINF